MSDALPPRPTVVYRCQACGHEFVPGTPGVAACPRCQSIGGHERHYRNQV